MASDDQDLKPISPRSLSIEQLNAIDLLVTGCSDKETAEKVGVDRSTVTKWRLNNLVFQEELDVQRQAVWRAAKEKLRSLLPEAADIVADAIRDKTNPNRVKLALDLLKTVKISDSLSEMKSPVEEDHDASSDDLEKINAILRRVFSKFPEAKKEFLRMVSEEQEGTKGDATDN